MQNSLFIAVLFFSFHATATAKPPEFLAIEKVKPAAMLLGKIGKAVITVKTIAPYHVQSNPASEPNLIATTLIIEKTDGLEPKEAVYPAGKPYRLLNSTKDISVYEGTFEIELPVQATSLMKPNRYELSGRLRFQACDEKKCYFPTSVPVTIPVQVYK